ncbi:MAG: menaquinone biosynthesis protein [Candidatus Aminicenantes bacterium]|nr:menaquinone biosynthesis protein [Candidatus Aminicenantes bacterium]
MPLRVSFIEFLNAVPLGWGFLEGRHAGILDVAFDVPSECARRLAAGEADVALIPVIECCRIPGLRVLPDICIASRQEVKSVFFVSKLPIARVSRLALDRSSCTSVALLKIILERFHGCGPIEYVVEDPDPERMLERYDGALVIGNAALQISGSSHRVYDLAAEWFRFTGLPFVFAVWAVRPEVTLGDRLRLFYESRERGLRSMEDISRRYAGSLGLELAEMRKYLLNLNYVLDGSSRRGLATFLDLAREMGLIPSAAKLEYYPLPDSLQDAIKG